MAARRAFLKQSSLLGIGVLFSSVDQHPFSFKRAPSFPSLRIPVSERRFHSRAVEEKLTCEQKQISGAHWATFFDYSFPQTLDERVCFTMQGNHANTVILSGNSMDLEDSTLQVWNYVPLCKADKKLELLIEGLLRQQWKIIDIQVTQYTGIASGSQSSGCNAGALCFPLLLAHRYWRSGACPRVFDAAWKNSLQQTLAFFASMLYDAGNDQQRRKYNGLLSTCLLAPRESHGKQGYPVHFNIATNLLVAATLENLSPMLIDLSVKDCLQQQCHSMAASIRSAIALTSTVSMPGFGTIYANETDLCENRVSMERADIRGLLSLPVLTGLYRADPVYQHTRTYALSRHNPLSAIALKTGTFPAADLLRNLLRGLTSAHEPELRTCLEIVDINHRQTSLQSAGQGYMYSLGAELIMQCSRMNPRLLTPGV